MALPIDDLYRRIKAIMDADNYETWPIKMIRKNGASGDTYYCWSCDEDSSLTQYPCIRIHTEDRRNDHGEITEHEINTVSCFRGVCTSSPQFRARVSLWTAYARMQCLSLPMTAQFDLPATMCVVCWQNIGVRWYSPPLCGNTTKCHSLIVYFVKASCALWGIKRHYCEDVWQLIATNMVHIANSWMT